MTRVRKLRRRRLQYSLRGLMVFVLLVSLSAAAVGVRRQRAARQRQAVELLQDNGVEVRYRCDCPDEPQVPRDLSRPGPPFLRKLLGSDFFETVTELYGARSSVTDNDLECLTALPHVNYLNLTHTDTTDTGLAHVAPLADMKWLYLGGTSVTDAGLVHLRGMTKLRVLSLAGTRVAGEGLVHLKDLSSLEELRLDNPNLTDHALRHVAGMTNLSQLSIDSPLLTDHSLRHVAGLTNLSDLSIDSPLLTDASLVYIEPLRNLQMLRIGKLTGAYWLGTIDGHPAPPKSTQITPEAVRRLQKLLPNTGIIY